MFEEGFDINPELRALWRAQDEADEVVPCTNYPDLFFPAPMVNGAAADTQIAKDMCAQCPITAMCASYGLNNEQEGIWGGLSPADRRTIRKLRGMAA